MDAWSDNMPTPEDALAGNVSALWRRQQQWSMNAAAMTAGGQMSYDQMLDRLGSSPIPLPQSWQSRVGQAFGQFVRSVTPDLERLHRDVARFYGISPQSNQNVTDSQGRPAWLTGRYNPADVNGDLIAETEQRLASGGPISAYGSVRVYDGGTRTAAGSMVEAGGLIQKVCIEALGGIASVGLGVVGCQLRLPGISCFTGDTLVITRRGSIRFDELTDQDEVLSAPEDDPHAPPKFRRVEEIFRAFARIWHLHVRGQVIRTTSAHPFWVWGKGWVAAGALESGDILRSADGQFVTVEDICDGGYEEAVYNCRIADDHTYFVGGEDWGFSVWAHNECFSVRRGPTGLTRVGRPMSIEMARRVLKRGGDIYTPTRQAARQIAGRGAIRPEIHPAPGEIRFWHFHAADRVGGHVFFGGGVGG